MLSTNFSDKERKKPLLNSSDSASAPPSGSGAILVEQSPYKASSYQSSQRSVSRCMRDGSKCSLPGVQEQ
jgi:hypothetical protein